MNLDLILKDIKEPHIKENFWRLLKALKNETFLKGNFRHFELTFTSAVTNFRYMHGLGFLPKDIIQTSSIGAGTVTWNYSLFTTDFLDITTTGAVVVRVYVGSHREDA